MEYLLVPDLRLGAALSEDWDPCVIAVDLTAFSLGVAGEVGVCSEPEELI